jgi:hypothetical protein
MTPADRDDEPDDSPESLADAFRQLLDLQKEIDAMAKRLVDETRVLADHRAEYRPVEARAYPAERVRAYDAIGGELAAVGIRTLGDFEDAAFTRRNPGKQVFVRLGLSDDGTIGAMWFLVGDGAALSVNSWMEDGTTITTLRTTHVSGVPTHPQDRTEAVPLDTPVRTLVQRHRSRLAAGPSLPRLLEGVDGLLQALAADEQRSAEFREAQGVELFEPMLRAQLGDRFDEEGAPLLEAIRAHPEWWTGAPGTPVPDEVVRDAHVPLVFLASRGKNGRGHLTTMGQVFRGYPEMQMKEVAGNHCRAARFLMTVVAHNLVAAAVEPEAIPNLELVLTRRDVPQPNPFTSWGHFPEVTEDGEARVRLVPERFGGPRGLLGFLRKDPELPHLLPPAGYAGDKDEWLRTTCRRLGQDTPYALGPESLGEAMQAASRRARATLREFRERFARGLPGDHALVVKVALTTTEGTPEYVWIKVTAWDDRGVVGTLETPPQRCPGHTRGQEMRIAAADIFDRAVASPSEGMIDVALTDIVAQEFGVDL